MKDPDDLFMQIAKLVATRSTCARLAVGCVLTTTDNYVISVGYNGSPSGSPHCVDVNRDKMTPCTCVHAEQNAIVHASADFRAPKVAYVTTFPCLMCAKLLVQYGVVRVVYHLEYREQQQAEKFLRSLNVKITHL